MKRYAETELTAWSRRPSRRPLVVRGARQVGKSHLVTEFGRTAFDRFLTLNFERNPEHAELFAVREPHEVLRLIRLATGEEVIPGQTLLFLDEIQAAPHVFPVLRYFFEELPELHVVAAGSLLDFMLSDSAIPVPVGRVEYLHLGPMAFEEFLDAVGDASLVDELRRFDLTAPIPAVAHRRLLSRLREYLLVGGMPALVDAFASGSLDDCDRLARALVSSYEDDFGKYAGRVDHVRLRMVLRAVPRLIGSKFRYVNVDRDDRAERLRRALDLLCQAGVALRVPHTSASGVPLEVAINERHFKVLMLDVGLASVLSGLGPRDLAGDDLLAVNAGATAEQFIGQELARSQGPDRQPELHCWARERRGASAEVDYVISEGRHVVPIEVKAGKSGTLRSLHVFLREKRLAFGVRFNSAVPSLLEAETTLPDGHRVRYRLLSLPLYLVGQARRLIRLLV